MADASTGHDIVWPRLEATVGVNVFDGEVPKTPPVDADGRVASYAVLYYSPGRRYASSLNGTQSSIDGTFQVTCVGGDPTRALWCVDQVIAQLAGYAANVDGALRRIRLVEEDPGPIRRDDNVTPPRHYVPLRFEFHTP